MSMWFFLTSKSSVISKTHNEMNATVMVDSQYLSMIGRKRTLHRYTRRDQEVKQETTDQCR